jgi:hypothetical protein
MFVFLRAGMIREAIEFSRNLSNNEELIKISGILSTLLD